MDSFRIVSIRRKKGREDRYLLAFDPERDPVELAGEVILGGRLATRQALTEERVAQLLADDEFVRCRNRAWSLLSRRKRARAELERELHRRRFSDAAIQRALQRLAEMGYIDDVEFARFWVLDRLERKRHGPRRVQRELLQKGVNREIVEREIAPIQDDAHQRERAEALLLKWKRSARHDDPRKRHAAASAFLARRGFDPDIIADVIRRLLPDSEDAGGAEP